MFEEVLSDTFSVYFKNVKKYLILTLVIALPLMLIQLGLSNAMAGGNGLSNQVEIMKLFKDLGNPSTVEKMNDLNKNQEKVPPSRIVLIYAVMVILMLIGAISNIAVIMVTNDYFQGKPFLLGDVMGRAVKKLPGIIGIGIIAGLACIVGSILLIIPGIILMVKFSLALPIYVLEDTSIFSAISSSFKLSKGKGWAILFNVVIFGILIYIVTAAFGVLSFVLVMIMPHVAALLTGQIIAKVAQSLAGMSLSVVMYLFYAKTVGLIPSKAKQEPQLEIAQ